MAVILLRHGESQANHSGVFAGSQADPSLTDRGRIQAFNAGWRLNKLAKFDRIITSPASRTRETADIVKREIGVWDVQIDPRLVEYDTGAMTGRCPEELGERSIHTVPGAENVYGFVNRTVEAVLDHQDVPVNTLIIAHRGTSMVVAGLLKGLDPQDLYDHAPSLENGEFMSVDVAALGSVVLSLSTMDRPAVT